MIQYIISNISIIVCIFLYAQSILIGQEEESKQEDFAQEIQYYVNLYPHFDEGFRILQIQDGEFPSFHTFLARKLTHNDDDDDNNSSMPMLGNVIQSAEHAMHEYVQTVCENTLFPSMLMLLYNSNTEVEFHQIISNFSQMSDERNNLERQYTVEMIGYLIRHRHTFMKHAVIQSCKRQISLFCKEYQEHSFKNGLTLTEYHNNRESLNFTQWDDDSSSSSIENFNHFNNMISEYLAKDIPAVLNFLFDMNPDFLRCTDYAGNGLLHHTARWNAIQCTDFLLAHGVNVHPKNKNGQTALRIAVNRNHIEIIEKLLTAHAYVNTQDIHQWSPLHEVADQNNLVIAGKLITAGAMINIQNKADKTPLHIAVAQDHVEMVRLLLDAGANSAIKNNACLTPLQLAKSKNSHEIIAILEEQSNVTCCSIS